LYIDRRQFIKRGALIGAGFAAAPLLRVPGLELIPGLAAQDAHALPADFKSWITGPLSQLPANPWGVNGTDLGIPYLIENGDVGYVFGDTFSNTPPGGGGPGASADWRSPVMLRSSAHPANADGILFESAAGQPGVGLAPQLITYNHNANNGGYFEVTLIPNDALYIEETGRHVMSYMSINNWNDTGNWNWETNFAGLAYSDNGGNSFTRAAGAQWLNDGSNGDPFQMCTMQRDGDWVYIFSVRAGRQVGPMLLRRVRWEDILDPGEYEGWGLSGGDWQWGVPPTALFSGRFGEPSVRLLADGTWAMSYLDVTAERIVTRTSSNPTGPWSAEVEQLDTSGGTGYYGGFIHPWSLLCQDNLHLMVSGWFGYRVGHWVGTL